MKVIFVFYSKSHGIQANLAFSKDLKHCNVIINHKKHWLMLLFERDGLHVRRLAGSTLSSLIRNLPKLEHVSAILSIKVNQRKQYSWFPWWARTCNEISRYGAGLDIGFTFTPRHLYSKLLKYNGKRNYQIESQWRRTDEFSIREQCTG